MAATANIGSNTNINIVNKRNSSGQNPNSNTFSNSDNGQV